MRCLYHCGVQLGVLHGNTLTWKNYSQDQTPSVEDNHIPDLPFSHWNGRCWVWCLPSTNILWIVTSLWNLKYLPFVYDNCICDSFLSKINFKTVLNLKGSLAFYWFYGLIVLNRRIRSSVTYEEIKEAQHYY